MPADLRANKTVWINYHSKCHPQVPVKHVSLGGTTLKWFDCI